MQDFGVAAVLRYGSRRKYWMVGERLVGRLLADSPAIPSSAIFAQRIEKVKLADFTLAGCRLRLQSWRVARNLHFGERQKVGGRTVNCL